MKIAALFFVFCFFHFRPAVAAPYKAGVFEYYPLTSDTPQNTIRKNLNEYRSYVEKAAKQGANIALFPEYGLTTWVNDPEEYAIDVTDTNDIIKELKAIAVENQMYIVVNLLEKVSETNKATKYYNTNLVFNRSGTIILKYRKINLYGESKLTPGENNQTLTFQSDFQVTFGIFTGYDILFDNPSRVVLDNGDVTDILYPTAWDATIPFFTALTVQHGYSISNGLNLLAAGYGKPQEGHGGSGIYLADGKIAEAYISDSASSKPIIQDINKIATRVDKTQCSSRTPFGLPTDSTKSNVSDFKTEQNFKSSDYTFKAVDLKQKNSTLSVCNNDLCCTFDIVVDLTQDTSDHYKVMAFDGFYQYKSGQYRTRICSLVACQSDSDDSCGTRLNTTSAKFTKITVQGNVKNEEGSFYAPVTLNSFLLPIKETLYCNNKNSTSTAFVKFETYRAQENVLVFGFYGKTTVSAAPSVYSFSVLMVLLSVVKFIF